MVSPISKYFNIDKSFETIIIKQLPLGFSAIKREILHIHLK